MGQSGQVGVPNGYYPQQNPYYYQPYQGGPSPYQMSVPYGTQGATNLPQPLPAGFFPQQNPAMYAVADPAMGMANTLGGGLFDYFYNPNSALNGVFRDAAIWQQAIQGLNPGAPVDPALTGENAAAPPSEENGAAGETPEEDNGSSVSNLPSSAIVDLQIQLSEGPDELEYLLSDYDVLNEDGDVIQTGLMSGGPQATANLLVSAFQPLLSNGTLSIQNVYDAIYNNYLDNMVDTSLPYEDQEKLAAQYANDFVVEFVKKLHGKETSVRVELSSTGGSADYDPYGNDSEDDETVDDSARDEYYDNIVDQLEIDNLDSLDTRAESRGNSAERALGNLDAINAEAIASAATFISNPYLPASARNEFRDAFDINHNIGVIRGLFEANEVVNHAALLNLALGADLPREGDFEANSVALTLKAVIEWFSNGDVQGSNPRREAEGISESISSVIQKFLMALTPDQRTAVMTEYRSESGTTLQSALQEGGFEVDDFFTQ